MWKAIAISALLATPAWGQGLDWEASEFKDGIEIELVDRPWVIDQGDARRLHVWVFCDQGALSTLTHPIEFGLFPWAMLNADGTGPVEYVGQAESLEEVPLVDVDYISPITPLDEDLDAIALISVIHLRLNLLRYAEECGL
jgi:hypothetical protein